MGPLILAIITQLFLRFQRSATWLEMTQIICNFVFWYFCFHPFLLFISFMPIARLTADLQDVILRYFARKDELPLPKVILEQRQKQAEASTKRKSN